MGYFWLKNRVPVGLLVWGVISLTSCGPPPFDPHLPISTELGSPRGYRILRVVSHFHSPFSYDACDSNGLPGGTMDKTCYTHLLNAMCQNKVDFLFMTDHPNHMADYSLEQQLVVSEGDQVLTGSSGPYGKKIAHCGGDFKPTFTLGFESQMMGLGMTQHLDANANTRRDLYDTNTEALRTRLRTDADALVVVPHTESKEVSWIQQIQPDAIEIYNFHANIDPKVRRQHLRARPFETMAGILTYLVDPLSQLVPDLGFMFFTEVFPVYFEKWNALIAGGLKTVGLAGTDSHENVFAQKVADQERFDSHRRITRIQSNHILVSTGDLTSVADVKDAIKKGRGWVVFEGLGSPVGMDFYATTGTTTVGVGETVTLQSGGAHIHVIAPTLYAKSPAGEQKPLIKLELRHVLSNGTTEKVAVSEGNSIDYETTVTGAYRATVTIQPKHLAKFLGDFGSLAGDTYTWIVSNHIYLQ